MLPVQIPNYFLTFMGNLNFENKFRFRPFLLQTLLNTTMTIQKVNIIKWELNSKWRRSMLSHMFLQLLAFPNLAHWPLVLLDTTYERRCWQLLRSICLGQLVTFPQADKFLPSFNKFEKNIGFFEQFTLTSTVASSHLGLKHILTAFLFLVTNLFST